MTSALHLHITVSLVDLTLSCYHASGFSNTMRGYYHYLLALANIIGQASPSTTSRFVSSGCTHSVFPWSQCPAQRPSWLISGRF
jgi:hypothetical protein